MKTKDLLTLRTLSKQDIISLISRANELKVQHKAGIGYQSLVGKTLGLIFEKPSTRTRVSFEAAMAQLGGTSIFLHSADTQIARSESVEDSARVLSSYLDGLVIRTFSQKFLEEIASAATIPVINGLTDSYHPCQVLSDLMTISEQGKDIESVKVAWVGDGNNVAHSWINAAAILGFELTLACPDGYHPDELILAAAVRDVGDKVRVVTKPSEAVRHADVIYTDVWVSMGQESQTPERSGIFTPYQVNRELVTAAKDDVLVMHCLPAHRGEEITADVIQGPRSVVWEQAANKLYMHKAILEGLIRSQD